MTTPVQYTLDTARAATVVATWALASDSTRPYAYAGTDHAAGLIATLYGAELLAAKAGVVSPTTFQGQQVMAVGQARSAIKSWNGDPGVRTLYLASYGAVRVLNDTAVRRQATTPYGLAPEGDALPIVVPVVIAVVAIAAAIATAWYFTSTKTTEIEVQGHNLRQAQLANSYTAMGLAALNAGQPVPPGVWQGLTTLADQEASHNAWILPTVVLAGGVAAGAGLAWKFRRRGR